MAMTFEFKVTVELERESGKFTSRDELADFIRSELEGMDFGSVDGVGADGDSSYQITSWNVDDI